MKQTAIRQPKRIEIFKNHTELLDKIMEQILFLADLMHIGYPADIRQEIEKKKFIR